MTQLEANPATTLNEAEHTEIAHCLDVVLRYAQWTQNDGDAWAMDLFLTGIIENAERACEVARSRMRADGWWETDGHWAAPASRQ